MASRWWVGGSGTWDAATTTHWSASSGGAGGASVPTLTDAVFFDANSGAVTVTEATSATLNALSVDFTGFTGTYVKSSGTTLTIATYLTLVVGMTFSGGGAGTISFQGTTDNGGAGWGITTAGKAIGNVQTSSLSSGGKWMLVDALSIGTSQITHNAGTLDTNNQTVAAGVLSSSNSNVRAVAFGSSSITLSGAATPWNATTATNLTVTANTATVTMNGALSNTGFAGGGANYNGMSLVFSGSGVAAIGGTNTTVANLTRTGTATKTDGFNVVGSLVMTGTLTLTGNSATNRLLVTSGTAGASRAVTAATTSLTNVDFSDIAATGAAAWTGTSVGDAGGNSGITFDASVQQTWSGNTTGNWSTAANWTSRVPLPQDDVVISGLTSGTVTADMPRLGRSITFTGSTGGTFAGTIAVSLYGSLTLVSALTYSHTNGLTFGGRSTFTVTTAGRTITDSSTWAGAGGTYTLQDAWTDNTQTFIVASGTVSANGQAVSTGALSSSSTTTRALSMGSGAWSGTRTVAGNVWNTGTTTGLTLTVSTAVFSMTGAPGSAATVTVTTGAVTMPSWTVNGGANLTCQFSDAFTTAGTITLTQAKLDTNNQTVSASVLALSGSSTRTITLGSSSLTLGNTSTAWNASTATSMTITANTATATLNGSMSAIIAFAGGGVNWNGLSVILGGPGSPQVSGSGTVVANLTRTGTAVKTDAFAFAANWTVTGTFTVTGNSTTNRVLVQSSTLGTVRTVTVNTTVTVTNADFRDITGAGTASWNLSAVTGGSGDALGNSGITFTTGQTNYWRGNGGSWSDVTHWANVSGGGASTGRVPLPQDNVVFDANSFSSGSQAVTMDMPRLGSNFTTTGVTNSPSLNTGSIDVAFYGNLTISSAVTRNSWSNVWSFQGRGVQTLTTGAGFSIPSMTIQSIGGSYTLQDAYSATTQSINVQNGTFSANNFTVTVLNVSIAGTNTRAVTMGTGAWSLVGTTGNIWSSSSTALTFTIANSSLNFTGTSGSAGITTGGVTMGPTTFNGAGGSWTLNDAWTSGSTSNITLTAGTLNTNGQSVTAPSLAGSNANVRTLTLGSSSLTLTLAGSAAWNFATTTNLTVTANTATATLNSISANFNGGGGVTWPSIVFSNATQVVVAGGGTPILANLTITGSTSKTCTANFNLNVIVNGTLTITGNSTINRLLASSNTVGTARTVTAATTSLTNVDFTDIAGAGAAAWTGTSLGDALGNSGITFDASTTQTHTASAGGNWSDVTKWTSRVPLPQDSVVVDVNTTGTLTADMPRLGKDLTFTGFLGTAAFSSTANAVFGSVTLGSGMTVSGTQSLNFSGRGAQTVTCAGKSFTNNFLAMVGPGGTYTQQDSFSHTGTGSNAIQNGGWDANNQAYTGALVNSNSGATRSVTMGSGTWTLTGAGTVWNFSAGALTLNAGTSTIAFTASNVSRTFVGAAQTYSTLRYDVTSPSQGPLVLTGANTFANLIVGDGRTLTLPSGTTTTVTSSISLSGTAYVGYLYLGGQAGQYVSTPNQAALQITGDIDIRVRVALDNWNLANQAFVAKEGDATHRAYRFEIGGSADKLILMVSPDGSTASAATCSVVTGFAAGSLNWVRATWRASDGRVQFFTASGALTNPSGADWTQLGTNQTVASGAIFASTSPLEIGSIFAGTTHVTVGKFYKADVRNNILDDGTGIAATFDASLFSDPFRYYSPTGNLLDKDSSDLEGSIGGWAAGTGAPAVTRDATVSAEGSASLKIVSAAAGSVVAGIGGSGFNSALAIPVVPGAVVSFLASVKGVVAALVVTWIDSAGLTISSPTAATFGSAGAFTDVAGSLTAPAAAMWAIPKFSWTAAAAGEVLNADKIAFQVGVAAAGSWAAGSVPWRINGYTNNPGVPFGRTALNASTAGTAATLSAAAGVTVTATYTHLKDSTATGGATFVYGPNGRVIANTSGWYYAAGIGGNPSLQWAVRALAGGSAQEVWRTAAALGDPSVLRWPTRAALGDTSDVRWGVRTTQGDQAALAWRTAAALGDSAILRWRTAAALGDSAALRWATRIMSSDEAALAWAVRTRTGDSAALLWSTRAAQGDQAGLAWLVRAAAGDQAALAWAARLSVGDAVALAWITRLLAGDQEALRWATRAALGDAAVLAWAVRLTAGDAVALLWITRLLAGDDVDLVWLTLYGFILIRQLIEVLERRQTVDVLERRQDVTVLGEGITR